MHGVLVRENSTLSLILSLTLIAKYPIINPIPNPYCNPNPNVRYFEGQQHADLCAFAAYATKSWGADHGAQVKPDPNPDHGVKLRYYCII